VRRALLLSACLALASCGSGGQRLSKKEYAKRADAVCARYKREQPTLANPANVTVKQVADLGSRTLPLLDRTIAQLRKLEPPKDEQRLADQWLSALDRSRQDAARIRDRARANDLKGVTALVAPANRDDRAASDLAAQLGMSVCSRP